MRTVVKLLGHSRFFLLVGLADVDDGLERTFAAGNLVSTDTTLILKPVTWREKRSFFNMWHRERRQDRGKKYKHGETERKNNIKSRR